MTANNVSFFLKNGLLQKATNKRAEKFKAELEGGLGK